MPNPEGRPTKLTPEILEKIEKYIDDVENHTIIQAEGFDKDGETRWKKEVTRLPTIERFAHKLKVVKSTLYEWRKPVLLDDESDINKAEKKELHSQFSNALSRLENLQAAILLENGTAGMYNAAVVNRVLIKHGFKDESDITSGGDKITGFNYIRPKEAEEPKTITATNLNATNLNQDNYLNQGS